MACPGKSAPCPGVVAAALRAAIKRHGARVVAERSGLSLTAVLSLAAGSDCLGSTVSRARTYLEGYEDLPRSAGRRSARVGRSLDLGPRGRL